jgi:N-methylhydantoinase A
METMATAEGILDVVTANMAKAIRFISVQRGHDPRDYALMAFGGAGPVHAARLARALDMRRVIVPPTPGTLCALGLLMTELRSSFAISDVRILSDAAMPAVEAAFASLAAQADAWFAAERVAPSDRTKRRTIEMRYAGQNYELSVPVAAGSDAKTVARDFAAAHLLRYGFDAPEVTVQLVTLRVDASGPVPAMPLQQAAEQGVDASGAISGRRNVWFSGRFVDTPIYERALLQPGNRFAGPAIVEQLDATTLVPPGMSARVDTWRNLVLEEQ